MPNKGSNSKRKALRHRLSNKEITYMSAAGELGQANLDNISTSGCLLSKCTSTVNKDEQVLIVLDLVGRNKPLELKARVVRMEKEGFSAEFTDLDESFIPKLATMLAKEIRSRNFE